MVLLVFLLLVQWVSAITVVDDESWWRNGVIYQVYPRSFLDGCSPRCTGVGSLKGVISKLDYLSSDVGVTALWLSPIYDSPMADMGYDISNFTSVWPTFGTLDDVDELITTASKKGIKIIMDLVSDSFPKLTRTTVFTGREKLILTSLNNTSLLNRYQIIPAISILGFSNQSHPKPIPSEIGIFGGTSPTTGELCFVKIKRVLGGI
jgi:hypothetical protein